MPANLKAPFAESCCDGGETNQSHRSAQVCGCDPDEGWICARHQQQQQAPQVPASDPLAVYLDEVVNKTWNYAGRCDDLQDEIMNAVLGVAGEAGEIADLHKKIFFHTKAESRRQELLLELGDLTYYFTKLLDLYGFTLAEVLEANKAKLFARHGVENR